MAAFSSAAGSAAANVSSSAVGPVGALLCARPFAAGQCADQLQPATHWSAPTARTFRGRHLLSHAAWRWRSAVTPSSTSAPAQRWPGPAQPNYLHVDEQRTMPSPATLSYGARSPRANIDRHRAGGASARPMAAGQSSPGPPDRRSRPAQPTPSSSPASRCRCRSPSGPSAPNRPISRRWPAP